ncbi:hypothetical protein BGZ94_002396 [Podila epigama]|nr:hypothetical protein BGZ94_002396 [Podila epigama]
MLAKGFNIALTVVTALAIFTTLLLHNYARIGCRWQWPSQDSFVRMVVMADPQMEGDAKIARLGKRAHIDLAFNDAYMHHIYRSMMSPSWSPLYSLWALVSPSIQPYQEPSRWIQPPTIPTHVTILGDLFSSQWIDNNEFEVRLSRYQSIFTDPLSTMASSFPYVQLPEQVAPEMINITGNHDIGYGYDISRPRIDRWERAFGKSNFITTITIPSMSTSNRTQETAHTLHFVVLNTMLIDGPSADENLRGQTWEFLQEASKIKENNPLDKIVLLTHIPFHKEKGLCVDPPDVRVHWDNTIIEQTMLTPNTTTWILNNLKPDFVLNGHDHEGCDNVHVASTGPSNEGSQEKVTWTAYSTSALPTALKTHDGKIQKIVREVTQRSMMAEFGGYSGLFEIRVEQSSSSNNGQEKEPEPGLEFSYQPCAFYNDLQIWIVIVTDVIVVIVWAIVGLAWTISHLWSVSRRGRMAAMKSKVNKEKIL